MFKKNSKNKQPVIQNSDQVARALEILFATDYIDKKKLYFHNFLRGLFFGFGSLLGATVVITVVLWILSLFDTIPLIGPLLESTQETIKQE